MGTVSTILVLIAGLISIPAYILFCEIIAGLTTLQIRQGEFGDETPDASAVVIVPAHNEGAGVVPTIHDIKSQLRKNDRLLVVADNCTDDTATIAEAAGAEVVVRNDVTKIGKGYALDWGLKHISANPPDFVIFIDADCRIQPDLVQRLKRACARDKRPLQACFLMTSPPDSSLDYSVAELAWIVKNWVRPLGLRALDCPVQMMGTGMIVPWNAVSSTSLGSGDLVEDLKLGLDLAMKGHAPRFFPFVVGISYFPLSSRGASSQRQRWETGHIQTILRTAPRMLYSALRHRNFELLILTLDMIVPPLSILASLIFVMFFVSSLFAVFTGRYAALIISGANLLGFMFAIGLAWLRFGREVLPPRALLSIGPYVASKYRLYAQILSGKNPTQWVRTDRERSE
jgi:glycosyltransferase involved in cell wall biosynthesis